jgi:oligopeptidase B
MKRSSTKFQGRREPSLAEKLRKHHAPTCFAEEGTAMTVHGDTRQLPYYWLRKKRNPRVRQYLQGETKYANAIIPKPYVDKLYREQCDRIKDTDVSVPYIYKGYYHFVRDREGLDYEIHCRKPVVADPDFIERCIAVLEEDPEADVPSDDDEEVLLDLNAERKLRAAPTIELEDMDTSPDQTKLAYIVNLAQGAEEFTLFVKDILTGTILRKVTRVGKAGRVGEHVAWVNDSVLYFTLVNSKCRSYAVVRCDLDAVCTQPPTESPITMTTKLEALRDDATYDDDHTGLSIVFKEHDDKFTIEYLCRTHDESHVAFCCESPDTSEWHFSAMEDDWNWAVFWPRKKGVHYDVFMHPMGCLVTHDRNGSVNMQLDICQHRDEWPVPPSSLRPLIAYDPAYAVEDVDCYMRFVLVTVLVNAYPRVLILDHHRARRLLKEKNVLEYSDLESVADIVALSHPEWASLEHDLLAVEVIGESDGFEANYVRIRIDCMRQPSQLFELTLDDTSGEAVWNVRLIHREPILGEHDPTMYRSTLVWAPAPAGLDVEGVDRSSELPPVKVPISLTWHVNTKLGKNALVLDTYGSYGDTDIMLFDSDHKSLLDRGVVLGFAMVRGGGQLGPAWHYAGRLLQRANSIDDFVACGEYLIREKWCSPDRLAGTGGSAGASVVGGAMLRRPALFRSVVLAVPFLDCLSSMLDSTLPLTTEEYDEWGNPTASEKHYFNIKAYSPMDNVPSPAETEERNIVFPHVLLDSSWHDTRVGIHEPAAFGAALRACWGPSAAAGRVLLHYCNFKADHGGEASRYDSARNCARTDAFVLGSLGVAL